MKKTPEEAPISVEYCPLSAHVIRAFAEVNTLADRFHPIERDEVMFAIIRIISRELNAGTVQVVYRTDMSAIGSHYGHVFADILSIARLLPTTGNAFTMMVLAETHTERTEAGRALMKQILTLLQLQQQGDVHLATIGGFDLVYEGARFCRGDGYRYETLLQRTDPEYEIELAITVTPLGAISRLEHTLDGFDDEQRQYRRRLEEAQRRLASYQTRTGALFQFANELDAKPKQLRDVDGDLAAEVIEDADHVTA
jgi:hypothetical protein